MSTKKLTDVKSTVKLAPKQNPELVNPDSFMIKVKLPFSDKDVSFNGDVSVILIHSDKPLSEHYFQFIQNVGLDTYVQQAFANYQRHASISKD